MSKECECKKEFRETGIDLEEEFNEVIKPTLKMKIKKAVCKMQLKGVAVGIAIGAGGVLAGQALGRRAKKDDEGFDEYNEEESNIVVE